MEIIEGIQQHGVVWCDSSSNHFFWIEIGDFDYQDLAFKLGVFTFALSHCAHELLNDANKVSVYISIPYPSSIPVFEILSGFEVSVRFLDMIVWDCIELEINSIPFAPRGFCDLNFVCLLVVEL